MAYITINGITINPDAPKPTLSALSLSNELAEHSDFVLVQPAHPLRQQERDALAQVGATVLEAVPGALVCKFKGTKLQDLRALPFVRWADVYPNVVKVAPALLGIAPTGGAVLAESAAIARPPTLDARAATVDVVLHRSVDVKAVTQAVIEAAHLSDQEVAVLDGKLRLTLKRRRLGDVANVDGVRHIEEVSIPKLSNNVARGILGIDSKDGTTAIAFSGKGELVAVADTGFDLGSNTDVHPAFKNRVHAIHALARPKGDDPHGHGTHVAGSVLGDGRTTADGPIRGVAPGALLVFQSAYVSSGNELGGLPSHMEQLFLPVYNGDGIRIHSNSWGDPRFEKRSMYDSQAREVDAFVHTHRDLLVCFSAGNEGKDQDNNGQIELKSITPPATAKNCLTIGATENNRPDFALTYGDGFSYKAQPMRPDAVANNPEGIVPFSSRGPTSDGRIKPDVVAPGSAILSARSRATKSQGWGVSDDPLYMYEGGTSMATPLVAGSAAVIREYLKIRHGLSSPSAALMKALIINGANPVSGQYVPSEAGAVPNHVQGFGRVDVRKVVGPYDVNEVLQFFDEAQRLDTGEEQRFQIALPHTAQRLKITLVWTDPPGEGLQSDLDLIVRVGDTERHGNMGSTSSDFDRLNNVEQVYWEGFPSGALEVIVRAYSITIDAQDFALVVRIF